LLERLRPSSGTCEACPLYRWEAGRQAATRTSSLRVEHAGCARAAAACRRRRWRGTLNLPYPNTPAQVLALSATFSAEALAGVEALMRRPQRVMLAPDSVSLLGVRQFYALVPGARPCCPAP